MCMSPDIPEHVILRQPPEAQAIIRALMARVTELKSEVIRLKAEVAALKLELGRQHRSPQNSSLPPSTQYPHARPALPQRTSKKKRGGQPGHTTHERALIPAEECHEVVTLKPAQCRRCGDESPTKQANANAWLWTFVAATLTVFALRSSRAATTITDLLGESFAGVTNGHRTRFWRYRVLSRRTMQLKAACVAR